MKWAYAPGGTHQQTRTTHLSRENRKLAPRAVGGVCVTVSNKREAVPSPAPFTGTASSPRLRRSFKFRSFSVRRGDFSKTTHRLGSSQISFFSHVIFKLSEASFFERVTFVIRLSFSPFPFNPARAILTSVRALISLTASGKSSTGPTTAACGKFYIPQFVPL